MKSALIIIFLSAIAFIDLIMLFQCVDLLDKHRAQQDIIVKINNKDL